MDPPPHGQRAQRVAGPDPPPHGRLASGSRTRATSLTNAEAGGSRTWILCLTSAEVSGPRHGGSTSRTLRLRVHGRELAARGHRRCPHRMSTPSPPHQAFVQLLRMRPDHRPAGRGEPGPVAGSLLLQRPAIRPDGARSRARVAYGHWHGHGRWIPSGRIAGRPTREARSGEGTTRAARGHADEAWQVTSGRGHATRKRARDMGTGAESHPVR